MPGHRKVAANRKHTIVASGCGDEDAETWVIDGANSAGFASGRRIKVIPFSPAVPGTQDLIQTTDVSKRWPHLDLQPAFETKGPWAVGQAVALLRSDAALIIGGGILTANVGSLALELQKPYYAVWGLGGAAKTIAEEDYAKHRTLGLPDNLLKPPPANTEFGNKITVATEFLLKRRSDKRALINNALILVGTVLIIVAFLGVLFHDNWVGSEPRLIYTTSLGAVVGVILSFLVSRVLNHDAISLADVLGQASLGCLLGVLYGFFVLEAGGFYQVDIHTMKPEIVDSVAIKMALVGIAVGALLRPAAKRALEELSHNQKV